LNYLELGAKEVHSSEQFKNVLGGDGSGTGDNDVCIVNCSYGTTILPCPGGTSSNGLCQTESNGYVTCATTGQTTFCNEIFHQTTVYF
jgi:hypothetical protein